MYARKWPSPVHVPGTGTLYSFGTLRRYSGYNNVAELESQIHVLVPVLRIRNRRIHMFLGLPDPDLLVRDTDQDPSIIKQKT
jgi:hypothetical protein